MPNTRIKPLCLDDLNDRERLQYRLEWENFSETKVKSDGNCQFRALAHQLYKTSDCHKLVRQEIVKQLKSHPKIYKGFVNNRDFSEYVKNMSNNSEWGDEVTLKAAADVYGVKIVVITSIKRTTFIEFFPKSQKEPGRVLYLSYLAGIHFNSIHKNEGSGLSSSSGSDTASIETQGKKTKNKDKDKDNDHKEKEEDNEKEREKEKVRVKEKDNKNKNKKKNEKNEKKEKKEEEMEKEEKEETEVKTEETEENNKKKVHCQFNFSDVMSILEQEDDFFC